MCRYMRRFEKIAEEKKRRHKKQETRVTVEDQAEILVSARALSLELRKKEARKPMYLIRSE